MEKLGDLTFRQMDESSAREIVAWRYDPPYDVYNCDPDETETIVQCFLTPQYRYYSVWNRPGQLVGYCCFGKDGQVPGGDYTAEALDVGAGLRPDLTGRGLGSGFIEAVDEFGQRRFAPVALRATVAAFNERALRVWEKLGYRRVQVFESTRTSNPFVVLMRNVKE
jgi:RimJ/RimL family protein N-acetyltransferase